MFYINQGTVVMKNVYLRFRIVLLLFAVMSISSLWGQVITGKVVDDKKAPVEYASIIGTLLSDTTKIIASAYSGKGGNFALDCSSYKNETMRLKISFVGFHTFQTDVPSNYTFENPVVLKENTIGLEEVTVSAYKRAITMTDGKIGVDVGKLTLGITDNFLDILKRTPGVIVSNDGIKVQGNEPLVIIDGVKQRIPMSTLLNHLKSLPAANLKKLYIKTVATAENRFSGEDATIEIHTKERTKSGYNISNTMHGTLLRNSAYRWGDYMNLRGKYGDLSGNASVGYVKSSFQSESEERYSYVQVDELLNQKETRNKDAYFGVLNLTWSPKVLNGSLNYFASYYVDDLHSKSKETYQTNEIVDKSTNRGMNDWTNLLSTNIEYLSADTLRHQFKVLYGLLTGSDDYGQISNNSLGKSFMLDKKMKGHRHIIEAQYTMNLPKFVYTIGSQSYISKINENVKFQNESDFTMWETIMGLYASGRFKFSQDLSMYLGLRSEYAHYKYIVSNRTSQNRKWDFAPYLTVDWKVSNNFSTSLYLTMKNNRPGYFSMLPGVTYNSDNEYSVGNPCLESSMQYDFKIQNLLFKYAVFTLGTRFIDNAFGTIYNLDNDGIRYTQPRNYANQLYFYGDISVPFSFFQGKLKGSLYLYLRNLSYHDVINEIKSSVFNLKNNWYGSGNLYASYQITENLGIYINPFFRTQNNLLQVKRKGIMSLDMGIQYTLPKNKNLAFALTVEDFFNQLKTESSYNYGEEHKVINTIFPNTQCVRLSITYNIGRDSKNIRVNKNRNDTSRFMK